MKLKINSEEKMFTASMPNEYYLRETREGTDSKGNLMYTFIFIPTEMKDENTKTNDKGEINYPNQLKVFTCIDSEGQFMWSGQKRDISNWCKVLDPNEPLIVKVLEKAENNLEMTCWVACDYKEDSWNGKAFFRPEPKYFWSKKPTREEYNAMEEKRRYNEQLKQANSNQKAQSQVEDDDDDLPF